MLSYYNNDYGDGGTNLNWGIFDKKLNSKLLHPYRIYKYLIVQYLNKYNKYAKCIMYKNDFLCM